MNPSPELKVRIGGMHCASCVSRVETSLKTLEGVKKAEVHLLTGMGLLELDRNIDWETLAAVLKDGGYSIEPWYDDSAQRELKALGQDWEAPLAPAIMSIAAGTVIMASMHFLSPSGLYTLGLLVSVPIQFFWGRPFVLGVIRWLRGNGASMETLVGLGTLSALALSLSSPRHSYFEVGVYLIGFVRFGKWLEGRAKARTGEAVRDLLTLRSLEALRVTSDSSIQTVPAADLRINDRVRILVGEMIPADGEVLSGHSSVDEAWLTGESLPAEKKPGSKVLAGSKNGLGMLEIRVTAQQGQNLLSQIIERVERAQMSRAPIQRLADQVSSRFIPAILAIAVLTFVCWMALGPGLSAAVLHSVSVLVIACPCALGLATPAAIVVGIGRATRSGILFKNGSALETLARAKTFLMDKTGTLTEGRLTLSGVFSLNSEKSEEDWFRIAASVEQGSEHRLAAAFLEAAKARGIALDPVERLQALPGQGLRASLGGKFILLGAERLLIDQGLLLPEAAKRWIQMQGEQGATSVILSYDFKLACIFSFKDQIRPSAPELLNWLGAQSLEVRMMTGDRIESALATGRSIGLPPDQIEAEILPHQKEARVAVLTQTRGPVVMVGDGINDAPALARASVSVSLRGASQTALDSAQIILMSGQILDLRTAIQVARVTLQIIRQNLFASAVYNLVGIPVAAGVFEHSLGISLSPALAGAAMAMSSLSVVLNSMRLRSLRLQ